MQSTTRKHGPRHHVWWSNAILFVGIHIAAIVGIYFCPLRATSRSTLVLSFVLWQAACFGVTIGYHRLYSHRSFEASFATRAMLALLGTSAFQGSIKWWVLRHRLHHRFTDDPMHDPYAATRGLLWSHMGWIFFKQHYERLYQVEKEDLENDPVVRFQHEHYVPLALLTSFVAPVLIGSLWGDAFGAFVWGGLVVRLAVWHCTFLVNSLAHWDGLQPYTDENTSRGNLIIALLTCGEGNHNFHAFPHDFRSGPSDLDWDPSKWIIILLHRLGLASGLRKARDEDLSHARLQMHLKTHRVGAEGPASSSVPDMTAAQVHEYAHRTKVACIIVIDDAVVDVAPYLDDHPGGSAMLRNYSLNISGDDSEDIEEAVLVMKEKATSAFHGGMNNHSRVAKKKLREHTIAHLSK